MKKHFFKLSAVLLIISIILSCAGCDLSAYLNYPTDSGSSIIPPDGKLTAEFLYVGQADCTLLTLPDGDKLLIDGGNNADGDLIADYIENSGVEKLDHVVCTHPHEDHIGGLDKIISRFEVEHIYMPQLDKSAEPDTKNYKDFLEVAERKECGVSYLAAGERLLDEDGVTVDCLSPENADVFSDLNNYSIVLKVVFGENEILLMGDAEDKVEDILLRSKANLDADILKVGHHGSSSSSTRDFVDAVSPETAIISCGKENTYGFPHEETMEALAGIDIYDMSQTGSVRIVSDGKVYTVTTDKNLNLDGNAK